MAELPLPEALGSVTPPNGFLAGRTAIVSGGGNGLGRAIARGLVAHGARVIVTGRHAETLAETVESAPGSSESWRAEVVDVTDASSVASLRETLADESISILVNNAGIAGPVQPLVDIDPAEWDAVFHTNVRGVFLMCQAFLPSMLREGSGDIINIASVSGKRPLPLRTPYAASKMAVIGLTATLGAEVGPRGIRVNSLSPGPVRGERMARNFALESRQLGISVEEAEARFASRSAQGRLIEESEVGAAVVAMLQMTGLCSADIDLSAGMVAR